MKKLLALILVLMLLLTSCGRLFDDHKQNGSQDQNITTEVTDTSTTGSDSTLPNGNQPGDDQPEDNQPEDNQPENNQPEDNQPENNQPEDNQPENNQPENNEPDNNQPENNQPEDNQPENNQPENNQPENNEPENNEPDNNQPENNQPEDNQPDDNQPENNEPDNNQPEDNEPDNNQPEDNQPENNEPDNNQPENNQPENNQPETTHDYKATVTAPTCDSAGYTTYTCSICGDSYTTDNVAPLGHDYKTTVTASTCTADGYTTYTCSVCTHSYVSDTVQAKGHSYKTTVTASTCTADGYTTYTCSVCTHSYVSDTVQAKGHSYKTTVTASTCTTDGYTTYTCSVCTYSYVSDTVQSTGHSWKEATTEAPKTCTVCGVTEGDKLPESTDTGSSSTAYDKTLYVSYINVGQGDSILIKVGDCDILIDAGTSSYGSTVSNYLKSQNVDDIELMINTHPDSDHCGGLTKVLNDFVVEEVWISKDTSKSTAAYTNFISAVSSEGLTAKKPNAGYVYTYEYLTMTVLYSSVGSDSNNSSIVIMLEYGSFKFLFTGDVGEEVETQLISSGSNLDCDVLKVGHHGSKYSSTAAFLSAVSAEYGVISVGSNSYGHPTSDALNRLSSAGVTVYRTDLNGNIIFSTNGATLYLPGGGTDSSGSGSGSSSGGSSSGGSSSGGTSSGGNSETTEYFIGNTETKVFHLPTCSNLPAASKQNVMYNYSWIVNIAGYTPCGRCLKNYSGGTGISYIANTESKVYHLSTCSYLPAASKQTVIYNTTGYTPCGHCIKNSSSTYYIANTETKVYHLSTCSYLPASSKQEVIYSTSGYTPCGHCLKG